jgi:tetratricopeptide (TPR) repeat protein
MEQANRPNLIGREGELGRLRQCLDAAVVGNGGTVVISGEPGIGKTALIETFKGGLGDVRVLTGASSRDMVRPFLVFSRILEGVVGESLFEEGNFTSLAKIFAINRAGLLVGQASPGWEALDADVFAGMFSAVQDFVTDSLDRIGDRCSGLGRLEYGDMKVLIEHGRDIFLTAVFKGAEHPDMRNELRRTVRKIDEEYGDMLASWSGEEAEVGGIRTELESLAARRFMVRRELGDVQLDSERMRISNEVLETVVGISGGQPLVMFLEDLHWADASSLAVLNFIVRNIGDQRVLVVCSLRRGENEAVQDLVDGLKDEDVVTEIALGRLGTEGIQNIVDELFPASDLPADFVETLATQCEGNPFFARELLLRMSEVGNIEKTDGGYRLASRDFPMPSSVEEVVNGRLRNLDADAFAMAEYASCIGKVFELEVAGSIQTLKDVHPALEKLRAAGVICVTERTAEFSHAIVHDVVYTNIGERWKAVHHKSLGEYYESAFADRLDEVTYELAEHYSRTNEHQKAFGYCVGAAWMAENAYAPEQALEFYENALVAVRELPHGEEREIGILLRIGENNQLLGRLADAEEYYRCAKGMGERMGDEEALAEVYTGLGNTLIHKPEYAEARALTEEALRMHTGSGNRDGMYKAMTNLGYLHFYRGEYGEALELFERQLKLAEEMGDRLRIGRTLSDIGGIYWDTGKYDQAIENNLRYLGIAEELGDKHAIKDALSGLANVSVYQKNYDYAVECYKRLIEVSEESGDLFMGNLGLVGLGATYEILGKYDDALQILTKCLETARRMTYRQGMPYVLIYLGRIRMNLGDYGRAEEFFREALEVSELIETQRSINFAKGSLGNLRKRLGEYDEAERLYDEAIAIGRETDHKHVLCDNLYQKADLCFLTARFGEAARLNDEAVSIAEEVDRRHVIFHGKILRGKLLSEHDRTGAIALLESMLGEAEDDAERAVVQYEIYKLTDDEARRKEALGLYTKLYETVPNILYKERVEEITK